MESDDNLRFRKNHQIEVFSHFCTTIGKKITTDTKELVDPGKISTLLVFIPNVTQVLSNIIPAVVNGVR